MFQADIETNMCNANGKNQSNFWLLHLHWEFSLKSWRVVSALNLFVSSLRIQVRMVQRQRNIISQEDN